VASVVQFHRALTVLVLLSFAPAVRATPIVPAGYSIGQISTGGFPLAQPTGLVVGPDGTIYVGRNFATGSSDILRISSSGDVAAIASFPAFVGGLALDAAGILYGSLQSPPSQFNNPAQVFQIQEGNATIFSSGLPHGAAQEIVIGPTHDLFVANFNGQSVSKVAVDGSASTFVGALGGPFGLAFAGNSLFVSDNANNGNGPGRILEIDPAGNVVRSAGPIPGRIIALEYGVTSGSFFLGNQGDTFVPSGGSPGIDRLMDGQITRFASGFNEYPRSLAFGPNGSLFVVDASSLYEIASVAEPGSLGLLAAGVLVLMAGVSGHRHLKE
jgi:hypothetical protein